MQSPNPKKTLTITRVEPAPVHRFIAAEPFRIKVGDGALVVTKGGAVYKLESILGVGGLSVVYLATRYADSLRVAFKLPRDNAKSYEDAVRLLRREAKVLSRLDHDNIVRVLDEGETLKGEPFVALDLVRAQTLDLLLVANGRKLPVLRACNIVLQVADALAHAHERGVVHRDIKPGNVMVRTNDGIDKVMLFDFGIASEDGDETEVADSGSILYASPEQLFNRVCTASSDVYSVSLLLFETLVGRLPFDRDVFPAVQYRQGELPILPDDEALGDHALPPPIRELLTDSLDPDLSSRPASMHMFAHRLRQIVTKMRLAALRGSGAEAEIPA
jgi:serine/threonine-protein kinase